MHLYCKMGRGGGNKRLAVVAISADSFWPCSESLVVTPDVTFSMPSHWTWNKGWIRDIYIQGISVVEWLLLRFVTNFYEC